MPLQERSSRDPLNSYPAQDESEISSQNPTSLIAGKQGRIQGTTQQHG